MYLVYLLKCDKLTYIGMTNNFLRRWRQHIGDLKGGARYTKKKKDWYPILIIDGFETMKEAMQCEWAVKHSKHLRGPRGRIQHLQKLLQKDQWTSKSPQLTNQQLTLYIEDEFQNELQTDKFTIKELYFKDFE